MKTRLAAELGDAEALRIYRRLGAGAVATAVSVPHCAVRVAYTPATRTGLVREWLGESVPLVPQCDGDLGARMAHAVRGALEAGARQVVVIGSDCPALGTDALLQAFTLLEEADVVLGPARDGGYYLIGLRAVHDALFDGIPWSSERTLAATLSAASGAGLRVMLLGELDDVDTADDWRRWQDRQLAP